MDLDFVSIPQRVFGYVARNFRWTLGRNERGESSFSARAETSIEPVGIALKGSLLARASGRSATLSMSETRNKESDEEAVNDPGAHESPP
jgi:hypothetical protein